MNPSEEKAGKLLNFLGLKSEPIISDNNESRADFRAFDENNCGYLFEVKSRNIESDFQAQLREKGEAYREDYAGRTNVMSSRVREAAHQLVSTSSSSNEFNLIIFVVSDEEPDVEAEQFMATLYGTTLLLLPNDEGKPYPIPCFYFTYSDFYRYKDVDGAIILSSKHTQFCPNPFGNRNSEFEQSYLFRKYKELRAVIDPSEAEERGQAFIADCDFDRRNMEDVINYIKTKYNLETKPILFEPKQYKRAIQLDNSKLQGEI